MRAAPVVAVACGDAGGWRAAQALLPALALGIVVGWAAGSPLGLLLALPAALAGWRWLPVAPARHLQWDGTDWLLATAERSALPGRVAIAIDLGDWMLLRFSTGDGCIWLPVASRTGGAWPALRAALYAQSPPAAAPQAGR